MTGASDPMATAELEDTEIGADGLGPLKITPHEYQVDGFLATTRRLEAGLRSALVVMPTGTGKTILLMMLARWVIEEGGRVLVVAHTGELIEQAVNKSDYLGLSPAIERAGEHARPDFTKGHRANIFGDDPLDPKLVIATVQTMQGKRLKCWPPGHFALIIVDEAHHAEAGTYRNVLDWLQPRWTVGFTATPDRGDGKPICGLNQVFEACTYEYHLHDAVRNGFLKRPVAKVLDTAIDLRALRVSGAKDLNEKELEELLLPHVSEICNELKDKLRGHRAAIFTPMVASADAIATALCSLGISACSVSGEDDDRASIFRDFREGRYQHIVNAMLCTEGWDEPFVDSSVILRPTKSRALYCLDDQTEILTDGGWITCRDDTAGRKAAAFDVETGEIRWSPILGAIRRPLLPGERMYRLKSPSFDIRVTDKHRMVYRPYRRNPAKIAAWEFCTAEELASRAAPYEIPCGAVQDAPGVPLADDELRFVGWFLTDGTLNRKNGAITIFQAEHQPHHDAIRSCIEGCGFKYSIYAITPKTQYVARSRTIRYAISKGKPRGRDKHLSGWGRLEPYIDKNLSPLLEDLTARQLAVLLEAVHLGDGSKQTFAKTWTRRSYHISTGNKVFAERLQSLCVRRGFRCNIAPITWNKNPAYMLHIKDDPIRHVIGTTARDRSGLEIEPAEHGRPGERVWCVETETGTIVTRRNGKVAILGNCQMAGRALRKYAGKPEGYIWGLNWKTHGHDLVHPVEIFDSPTLRVNREIISEASKLVDSGEEVDLALALRKAQSEVKLRKKLALQVKAERAKAAEYTYDPLGVRAEDVRPREAAPSPETRLDPLATEGQVEALVKFGIKRESAVNWSKARASGFIGEQIDRREKGLCSYRQQLLLKSLGHPNPRPLAFPEASAAIDALRRGEKPADLALKGMDS